MIITLKDANFSKNNIGTLSTWGITKILRGVSTTDTITRVNKNESYTATFIVSDGYVFNTCEVFMGGNDITNLLVWNDSHTSAILNIPKVTGNVYINIVALSETIVGTQPIPVTPYIRYDVEGETIAISITNKNSFAVNYEMLSGSTLPGYLNGKLSAGETKTIEYQKTGTQYTVPIKFSANGYIDVSETYTFNTSEYQTGAYGGEEFVGTLFFNLGNVPSMNPTLENNGPHIGLYKFNVDLDNSRYSTETMINGEKYYLSQWQYFAQSATSGYINDTLLAEFSNKYFRTATLDESVTDINQDIQIHLGEKFYVRPTDGLLMGLTDTSKVIK